MNEAASSVEPEVKTRFATVDAAFGKLCTKKMQKTPEEPQSRHYGHSDSIYVKKTLQKSSRICQMRN